MTNISEREWEKELKWSRKANKKEVNKNEAAIEDYDLLMISTELTVVDLALISSLILVSVFCALAANWGEFL